MAGAPTGPAGGCGRPQRSPAGLCCCSSSAGELLPAASAAKTAFAPAAAAAAAAAGGSRCRGSLKMGPLWVLAFAAAALWIPCGAFGSEDSAQQQLQRVGGGVEGGPLFDFAEDFFSQVPAGSLPRELPTNNEVGKPVPAMTGPEELNATLGILYGSYCERLKRDGVWRQQFLLLFLSALYWPMYTRAKHWRPPLTSNFFKIVLAKSVALNELDGPNQRTRRFVNRARHCGFQAIIEEGLPRLVEVTDYESFNALVKRAKKADPHLAEMLKFIPDLKWSLDDSTTTIGYVYHQISELHVLYSYSNILSVWNWMSIWERSFRQEQRSATSSVMLLALTNSEVTDRPMGGILVLKLSRLVAGDLLQQLRGKSEDDPSLEEELGRFEKALKEAILESVRQVLIRMALLIESNWLCSEELLKAQFPDVLVTAYRARGSGGPAAVVERGEFGSEISEGVVLVLNQNLHANEMYVQLSVADPITPQKPSSGFISALKAASMFKQRLEDDPSLPGVGLAEVVYSTFNDLQYAEVAGGSGARFDPDLHLLLQVPSEHFKDAAAFHDLFMGAILVQPLTFAAPRHVRPDRVRVMGYAVKAAGAARPIRMGKFGGGLAYSEQALVDRLIHRHGFLVHVLLLGLRGDFARRDSEATAEEIYKRFRSRTRGTINVVFIEPIKPPEVTSTTDYIQREEGYPGWVIGVAVGSVTVFFLGLLGCLILRKHVSMPWWIDCFCSPSPPSFQTRPDQTSGHGGGDLSRSSSFRPSVETGDSPYFESDEVKPSKRLGAPVGAPLRGAPPDVNVGWETGNLSTLEFARSKRMESKRSGKPPTTQLNSIPEFIAEAKMPNGWAAEAAPNRQSHNR